MNTAIIVDDEQTARSRLKMLLKKHEDVIEVIGEAKDGTEAIGKINELKPDVAFLDIQMPGIIGIELPKFLTHSPHLVFVTAYHDYAIKAFEQNSLDYLLKPVESDRLALTVRRISEYGVKAQTNSQHILENMLSHLKQAPKLDSIPVNLSKKIILIPTESIVYFEAKHKYVYLYTRDEHYLIDYSLSYLVTRLPEYFFQIHRTFIINRHKIKEIHKHLKSSFLFIMNDKSQRQITSGNTYYDEIKQILHI